MKKICPDQAALRLVQFGMRLQRLFHLCGARLEDLEQVPVTTFEIFEHFGQLLRGSLGLEPKNPVDDMVGPGLVGRVEVSGFSRRFEGPDDDPGRIRAQMQGLAVQELGLGQRWLPGVARDAIARSSALGTNLDAGFVRSIAAVRLNSPYLHKTKKIRQRRFRALVLIGSIRMEPIRAAARIGIDQCRLQVVFAQKPTERAHRPCRPLRAAIRPPRSKAGRNRCCRLDRLLIERFGFLAEPAEALGPDRPEASRWRGLKRHEPTKRSEAGLDVGRRAGSSGPFGSAPGEGARCRMRAGLRTRPSLWFPCREQGHQPVGQ